MKPWKVEGKGGEIVAECSLFTEWRDVVPGRVWMSFDGPELNALVETWPDDDQKKEVVVLRGSLEDILYDLKGESVDLCEAWAGFLEGLAQQIRDGAKRSG